MLPVWPPMIFLNIFFEVSLSGSYTESPRYIQSNVVVVLTSLSAFSALYSVIVETMEWLYKVTGQV